LKRIGGDTLSTAELSYSQVWTDPQQGRDEGLALIGRRVRCCFPKSVLSNGASTRIIEGEVISLVDYDTQWHVQRLRRQQRETSFTAVELLVDRKALEALPFLERTDEDVDTSTMSATEKKRQHFEDVIRGKNLVTVKVNLADASSITVDKESASTEDLIAKWVIRKRVPLPLKHVDGPKAANTAAATNGSSEVNKPPQKRKRDPAKSATLYIGDKNDPPEEQERNWRWLAGRYDDMLLSSGTSRPPEQQSCGMTGEVLKVEPTTTANGAPSTLATVTLRRMLLPEHCVSGRQSHHGPVEIFDDADASVETGNKDAETNGNQSSLPITFQIPVEELVIISRKFERKYDTTNGDEKIGNELSCPAVTRSYSYRTDSYRRLTSSQRSDDAFDVCHRCRKAEKSGTMERVTLLSGGKDDEKLTCHECQAELRQSPYAKAIEGCDCRACTLHNNAVEEVVFKKRVEKAYADLSQEKDGDTKSAKHSAIALAFVAVRAMRPSDFVVPRSLMEFKSLPEPSEKPITKSSRGRKTPKKTGQKTPAAEKGSAKKKAKSQPDTSPRRFASKVEHVWLDSKAEQEEEKVFVPSCSRLLPYDLTRKHSGGSSKRQMRMDDGSSSNQAVRPSLPSEDAGWTLTMKQASRKRTRETERVVEHKSTSRAARADQRRLKRGVAALGSSSIGLDALAGREQQLRFDRSSIHAWGVFADEDINAGDMVVEYRGELIGNAMAEKREVEYEKAKIGSDYMFRIDGFLVCDATKQGNVARFINASCDPNCYTQIITMNGSKRIVIYAKRDIKAGEELCYDYKFPFEHDETKRIPCHCGAQDCRGFMNWDKRYVSLPANANMGAGQENKT